MTAIEPDIIGTRPKPAAPPLDFGLFATPPAPPVPPVRPHTSSTERNTPANVGGSHRRRVRRPDDFAEAGIRSDDADRLTEIATRAFKVRAEFDGQVESWQVLLDMMRDGVLDGTESTDFLGACGRRAELVAGEVVRVPMTLPDEYTRDLKGQPLKPEILEAMRAVLKRKHGNRCTVWRRPTTPTQRAAMIAEAQGVR